MAIRHDHRARYIDAWNAIDAEELVSSVSEDFVFDDPCEPELIGKSNLARFLPVGPKSCGNLVPVSISRRSTRWSVIRMAA